MKAVFSHYKIEIIVIVGLLLLGAVIGVTLLRNRANSSRPSDVVLTTPVITKTPENELLHADLDPQTQELKILSVTPDPAKGPYYNNQVFTIVFNDTMNAPSLLVGMGEKFPIRVLPGDRPDEVTIGPDTTWDVNHDYAVNIYPGSAGMSGKILKTQYEFIFRIAAPKGIDGE